MNNNNRLTPMEVYILWRAHCQSNGKYSDSIIKFEKWINDNNNSNREEK